MKNKNDELRLEDVLIDRLSDDDLLEIPLAEKIFRTFFLVTGIIGIVIIIQFLNIGMVNSGFYKKSALANMTQAETEPAPRGLIKDRFGSILAYNEPAFRAFLAPNKIPQETKERELALNKIGEVLGIDKEELLAKIANHDWWLGRLLLDGDLSHEKLVRLSSDQVVGIDIKPGFKRVHSTPLAFSHVLGYTGLVNKLDLNTNPELSRESEIGKTGLELQYDDILRGKSGREILFLDALGAIQEERKIKEAEKGGDLETYIDKEFQEYFYQKLEDQIRLLNIKGGAVGLALNPQNGEVLALVSLPSFDIGDIPLYLKRSDQPLFNRALSGLYSPGSTIKPLVATAVLEEGVVSPADQYYSAGYIKVENPYYPDQPSIFHDWKPHGWVNLVSAIARSSNVYFYIVGGGFEGEKGLGITRLRDWWGKFLLDQKTLIDLPGEKEGFLPSPEWKENTLGEPWRVGDTYNVSIGQGDLLVTPLELLNYISAIANNGKFYKLRVAKTGSVEILRDLSGDLGSSLRVVREGMEAAVRMPYGTAYQLSDLPFSVGAKTGTSQVSGKKLNAFFVGYAPAEDPQLAILVLIEDAREGSLNAVPVARDVMLWYYENRIKK